MAKKFPKTIYVKIESGDPAEYFIADEDANSLVEMGETVKIASYQLVEISEAQGVAQFKAGGTKRR